MKPWSLRVHRMLRLALPARIRRQRRADMDATFLDMLEQTNQGPLALGRLWWGEMRDVVGTGVRLRLAPGPAGRRTMPRLGVSGLDVQLGLRMLAKQPGMTAVAVFALAVAIPAGLAPAHLIDAVFAPLPVEGGERIQVLRNYDRERSRIQQASSYDYLLWRRELTSFAPLAAASRSVHNVILDDGAATPVTGAEVTASTFEALRVQPLLGRTLVADDERPEADLVVVLGHDLWRNQFGGAADVLGRNVRIGGVYHTVVGVMPEGFFFPSREHLWLPLKVSAVIDDHEEGRSHLVFGRLADGVSAEQAEAEAATIGAQLALEVPDVHALSEPQVVPYTTGALGFGKGGPRAMPAYWIIQALTLVLVVVACANVAMLVLARTATRSAEIAVRTALGASRMRVVSQLFTEALVFAVLAAGLGLLVVQFFVTRLGWVFDQLPYWVDAGVSIRTAMWAFGLAAFSAAVVGVVPALKVTGAAVHHNLQAAAAGRNGVRFGGLSTALVVFNVALAVTAVGFAVSISGVANGVEDGMSIDASEYLFAEIDIPRIDPGDGAVLLDDDAFTARVARMHRELLRRLAGEPGVGGVAIASRLPGTDHLELRVEVEDDDPTDGYFSHYIRRARVDIGFFESLDQPVLSGRQFDRNDLGADRAAVIVNTNFVERVLEGRSAVGRRLRYMARGDQPVSQWYEIVGVVDHLGMYPVNPGADEGVYHPAAPGELHPIRLAIHRGDDPTAFTARLRKLAAAVDPIATVGNPQVLDEVFSLDRYFWEWSKLGMGIMATILVSLSISGIYALMSFTVAERTREIGIRAALGAQRGRIVATVARRSFVQLGLGTTLGVLFAWLFLKSAQNDLGSLPDSSPLAIAIAVGIVVLAGIGVPACLAPTLRAVRIMPTEALRSGE